MSRYPDNPWWHQERDSPITIQTRLTWDEAAETGHLTAEHVIIRLKNIADHVFGDQTHASFDEDGFLVSLTAAGLLLPGGVKLCVYPADHIPPHAHVRVRGKPDARIRVDLTTGDFLDETPRGISANKLRGLQQAVRDNHDALASWWRDYHGDPVVLE